MMAHAREQAGQSRAAQVNISGVCNQHYACSIQECRMVMWHSCVVF
jgi:hypothetical protein